MISLFDTKLVGMVSSKHKAVYEKVFKDPVSGTIKWVDIMALLKALGAQISEGNGSRVRISLNGVDAVFHRPHPRKETDKEAVKSARRFLIEAEVKL